MIRCAVAVMLCASPATAQELVFSPAHTKACLEREAGLDGLTKCVGTSAMRCMEETPGGHSTAGQGGCLSAELDWWDAKLNVNYRAAMAKAKALDADQMGLGTDASVATSLRDMQRAWIPFRDAKCAYARSQWGGGTGGGPAQLWCLMYETAWQARELEIGEGG